MKSDGRLVIAEWNRDEVAVREGTPSEWMKSLAEKVSPGHFIAYWLDKDETGALNPTKQNPIVVYEGGHRTRWTEKVFNCEVLYHDMAYDDLKIAASDVADRIRDSPITMTVAFSRDESALITFAKNEYGKVNALSSLLKPGEIIRTKSDPERSTLEEAMRCAMRRTLKSKKRNSDLEGMRALVHGAAGLIDRMDKKAGSLINGPPLSTAQVEAARNVIKCVAQAEEQIEALFEKEKATLKRCKNRGLELPVDGVLVWKLQDVASVKDRDGVVKDWVEFHRQFFADKEGWNEKMKQIKAATKERARYGKGETPFPTRWARVQSILYPQAVDDVVDETIVYLEMVAEE